MKKSHVICTLAIVALSGMAIKCNDDNPISSIPRVNFIYKEGFEDDLSKYDSRLSGMMSISKRYAHSSNSSLTSDSNNTCISRRIEPEIYDSIAGLQFYIMALKKSQTNTIAMIAPSFSTGLGYAEPLGMGISKSDSLVCVYGDEYDLVDPLYSKNFGAFELNKWYKCKIEYNFSNATITYYLDDKIVHTRTSPYLMSFNIFVVRCYNTGAQDSSGYYIDDVTIYKR